jgi:hypothetical protein
MGCSRGRKTQAIVLGGGAAPLDTARLCLPKSVVGRFSGAAFQQRMGGAQNNQRAKGAPPESDISELTVLPLSPQVGGTRP